LDGNNACDVHVKSGDPNTNRPAEQQTDAANIKQPYDQLAAHFTHGRLVKRLLFQLHMSEMKYR